MTTQDVNPPREYSLRRAFQIGVQDYKPWHKEDKHSLYILIQKAEELGLMDRDKAEELGVKPHEYDSVREGMYVPSLKVRRKIRSHWRQSLGLRKPKGNGL